MNTHEIYPNAPLVLVALEVRHPATDPISTLQQRELKQLLAHRFPLQGRLQQQSVQLSPDNNTLSMQEFPQFRNRENTMTVTYRPDATVIEATAYPGWSEFRSAISDALNSRDMVTPLDGLDRVGLRYVDEIRLPEGTEWSQWIDGALLGPGSVADMELMQWQGIGVYATPPERTLVLRYGRQFGRAVETPLRGANAESFGWFFLFDVDSYWERPHETPEYQLDSALTLIDDLHAPVRSLFESKVTDRYRDEILRSTKKEAWR